MHNGKPVIGLTSSFEKGKVWNKMFIYQEYMEFIRSNGAIPLVIPVCAAEEELEMLLSMCDGVVLTGGNDIHPDRYGEEIRNDTVKPALLRDDSEWKVLDFLRDTDVPVLGICRGLQLLNVYYGGSLYQDIPSQLETPVLHSMEAPYIRTCHDCHLVENSALHRLLKQDVVEVNSHHHQSVKDLAPGFEIMAMCSDGVVEAIGRPDHRFMWAVQWHPERIWGIQEKDRKILQAFLDACRG